MSKSSKKSAELPTREEFINECVKILCNAVICKGLVGLKNCFQYEIMQWWDYIHYHGGFREEK